MLHEVLFRTSTINSSGGKAFKKIKLPCQMLITCHTNDVDASIFTAITENSLVYDGRMVVDASFATADPNVFAAGTVAKFSRRYGVSLPQERNNSVEIGQHLAESVLKGMDPLTAAHESKPTEVPSMGKMPKCTEGVLPGELLFFNAVMPVLVPIKKPKVLVTNKDGNLCRLVFDDLDILVAITYCGKNQEVHRQNLCQMLGQPSNALNRVLWRYEEGLIDDFLAFLQAPWATALAHEAFPELLEQITDGLLDREGELSELLETYMTFVKTRQKGVEVPTNSVSDMVQTYLQDDIKREIQLKVLQFLNLHRNHLPGYQVSADPPPVIEDDSVSKSY